MIIDMSSEEMAIIFQACLESDLIECTLYDKMWDSIMNHSHGTKRLENFAECRRKLR